MIERPKLTKELIATVAAEFCQQQGWEKGAVEDLTRVCRHLGMDGYALAKALDEECGWSPTALDVEALDDFSMNLGHALRKASIDWARENNIQPPFPIGTMTTRGEITGICTHEGACYEIRKSGDTNSTRRYIVRFEDVRAIEKVEGGAA